MLINEGPSYSMGVLAPLRVSILIIYMALITPDFNYSSAQFNNR